jgi:hypothetical protein
VASVFEAAGESVKAASHTDREAAVLDKIAAMLEPFRTMGERVHAIVLRSAPGLQPKGMACRVTGGRHPWA